MSHSLLLPFGCYYHTFASPPPPHILELGLRNFPQFGLGQRDLLRVPAHTPVEEMLHRETEKNLYRLALPGPTPNSSETVLLP